MKYVYEVEEYSQDSRHYTVESEVKLTEEQINLAYCEVGLKEGDENEFTLADIDDDVLTPENKININVTFKEGKILLLITIFGANTIVWLYLILLTL